MPNAACNITGTAFELGACPFCKGKLSAVTDGDCPAIFHTMPYCEEFARAEDALDFAKRCNRRLEN